MPPTPTNHPCAEHARRLDKAETRLERGDAVLDVVKPMNDVVKRIETAVCGDPEMGVEGLASLPKRVQALERRQWWMLGGVAALSTGIPMLLQLLGK